MHRHGVGVEGVDQDDVRAALVQQQDRQRDKEYRLGCHLDCCCASIPRRSLSARQRDAVMGQRLLNGKTLGVTRSVGDSNVKAIVSPRLVFFAGRAFFFFRVAFFAIAARQA